MGAIGARPASPCGVEAGAPAPAVHDEELLQRKDGGLPEVLLHKGLPVLHGGRRLLRKQELVQCPRGLRGHLAADKRHAVLERGRRPLLHEDLLQDDDLLRVHLAGDEALGLRDVAGGRPLLQQETLQGALGLRVPDAVDLQLLGPFPLVESALPLCCALGRELHREDVVNELLERDPAVPIGVNSAEESGNLPLRYVRAAPAQEHGELRKIQVTVAADVELFELRLHLLHPLLALHPPMRVFSGLAYARRHERGQRDGAAPPGRQRTRLRHRPGQRRQLRPARRQRRAGGLPSEGGQRRGVEGIRRWLTPRLELPHQHLPRLWRGELQGHRQGVLLGRRQRRDALGGPRRGEALQAVGCAQARLRGDNLERLRRRPRPQLPVNRQCSAARRP
mmetsp:Transcript_33063/g.102607  ORF Transcript_33063/g.102607 Transcript_33063/m.102607 type:complete len:393 (+) Transcript_33063:619-1797(+)